MKIIILVAFLSLNCWAAPTIHVASNLGYAADLRVAQISADNLLLTYAGTGIRINPTEGDGFFEYWIEDVPAGLFVHGFGSASRFTVVDSWYPPETFYSPLPTGYDLPGAHWVTNSWSYVFAPFREAEARYTFDVQIDPHQNGHVWLDWAKKGGVRMTWSSTPPSDFGAYRFKR